MRPLLSATTGLFQSTPSVWRATSGIGGQVMSARFQSTPSVWRATGLLHHAHRRRLISIHALRVEGDPPLHG